MFSLQTDDSVLVTKIEFDSHGIKHSALLMQPKQPKSPTAGLLWIHGGGYMAGFKEMAQFSRAAELVKRFGIVVLAPDYRLSIQVPYPAAINDCYDALIYLKENAAMLGVREDQIMVGGESAGGGLTAALCIMARDKGEVKIAYQMPLYPMLDNFDTESSKDNHGKNWDTRRNHLGWKLYLRDDAKKEVSPYAAAARETDYSDLPPAYTFVGDGEPFYCEALTYIDHLKQAGIEASVDVYASDFHAFDLMHPEWEISKEAIEKFNEKFAYALEHYFAPQSNVVRPRIRFAELAKNLRHELHRHAELSMEESTTMEILKDFIKSNSDLQVVDQGQWFYAFYDSGDKNAKTIAYRADMDALPLEDVEGIDYASITPGVAHKCGHDGHSAILAAFACKMSLERPDRNIYFIFQPGEEIGAGAKICAPIIREKKIEKIYAFHNWSGFPFGSIVYRNGLIHCPSMGVTYQFLGENAHASQPEDGKSPAGAIASFVLSHKEAIKDLVDASSFATLVGAKIGNSDFGIAPGEGEVSLTLRSTSEETMYAIEKAFSDLAEGLCKEEGLGFEKTFSDVFPETVNADTLVQEVLGAAQKLQLKTVELVDPIRSSEDYGYFQKECDGVIFYIGNGEKYPQIHTRDFNFNDNIIPIALDMFTKLAQL